MIILFITGLILGGVSVIFALQNVAVVTITFFSWQLTGSLAIILLFAIFAGILVALLLLLPENVRSHFRYKTLIKEYRKIAEELRKQKELTEFAKKVSPTEHNIEAIVEGESPVPPPQ